MKKPSKPAPAAGKKNVTAKPAAKSAKAKAAKSSERKVDKKSPDKVKPSPIEATKLRIKLVRDSFTMPREDFERIARLKSRAIGFKRPAKKSELLRAGLQVLERMNDLALQTALAALTPIKTGRPKKH